MLIFDGNFRISQYQRNTSNRVFTDYTNLSIDQIFPSQENTTFLAVSGTTSNYVFLGLDSQRILRFKTYDPVTGILNFFYQTPYTFDTSLELQRFVYNNAGEWFITAVSHTTSRVILQGSTSLGPIRYVFTNALISELQMDPQGSYLYFARGLTGFKRINMFSLSPSDPGYIGTGSNGYRINLSINSGFPTQYTQFSVSITNSFEELIFINPLETNYFYRLDTYIERSYLQSNVKMDISIQELQRTIRTVGGFGGSKWMSSSTYPFLVGNRGDSVDARNSVNIAWQIFFPVMKIEMLQLTGESSVTIDRTGVTYPEWPHTAMFVYSNYSNLVADISGNGGQWGLESSKNFLVSDVSMNGFYFNSYIQTAPLYPNYNGGNYETDYYVAIRGWLPTESFQTLVRFYLPDAYDYGYMKIQDLVNEAETAKISPTEFSRPYHDSVVSFTSNFVFSNRVFGSNSLQGFAGAELSSIGVGDFMRQYSNLYVQYSTNTILLETIQSNARKNLNTFIASNLKYILPSSLLTRQRFTDPLLFSIMWNTQLPPTFSILVNDWGLGWNLGYAKVDTPYSTIQIATSLYKIQNSFIYLRLNPEFNLNAMDVGGRENYISGREPTGATGQYYCKLLLTDFGGNATTFIHNPVVFNPPLTRLSHLTFQWTDSLGNILNNNDSEWDMTLNLVENVSRKLVFSNNPTNFTGPSA